LSVMVLTHPDRVPASITWIGPMLQPLVRACILEVNAG
jgi:hypothetical protein